MGLWRLWGCGGYGGEWEWGEREGLKGSVGRLEHVGWALGGWGWVGGRHGVPGSPRRSAAVRARGPPGGRPDPTPSPAPPTPAAAPRSPPRRAAPAPGEGSAGAAGTAPSLWGAMGYSAPLGPVAHRGVSYLHVVLEVALGFEQRLPVVLALICGAVWGGPILTVDAFGAGPGEAGGAVGAVLIFSAVRMGGRREGRMDGRRDGRRDGGMEGWRDGRTEGWVEGRTDGRR